MRQKRDQSGPDLRGDLFEPHHDQQACQSYECDQQHPYRAVRKKWLDHIARESEKRGDRVRPMGRVFESCLKQARAFEVEELSRVLRKVPQEAQ